MSWFYAFACVDQSIDLFVKNTVEKHWLSVSVRCWKCSNGVHRSIVQLLRLDCWSTVQASAAQVLCTLSLPGNCRSMFGRMRLLEDIQSPKTGNRLHAERQAGNFVIQGKSPHDMFTRRWLTKRFVCLRLMEIGLFSPERSLRDEWEMNDECMRCSWLTFWVVFGSPASERICLFLMFLDPSGPKMISEQFNILLASHHDFFDVGLSISILPRPSDCRISLPVGSSRTMIKHSSVSHMHTVYCSWRRRVPVPACVCLALCSFGAHRAIFPSTGKLIVSHMYMFICGAAGSAADLCKLAMVRLVEQLGRRPNMHCR